MIKIFSAVDTANAYAAERFLEMAKQAVAESGHFSVALSGGSTPKGLYKLLARPPYLETMPWDKTFVFWSDERCVPEDSEKNNAKMAFETLLDHVPIPKENIHRIQSHLPPEEAARDYQEVLQKHFTSPPPYFDLMLLGMGDDGHTASLFPGTKALGEQQQWVAANFVEKFDAYRITLTYPMINHSRHIMFLVYGEGKRAMLTRVLHETHSKDLPVQKIQPTGEIRWLVDEAAGKDLMQ